MLLIVEILAGLFALLFVAPGNNARGCLNDQIRLRLR